MVVYWSKASTSRVCVVSLLIFSNTTLVLCAQATAITDIFWLKQGGNAEAGCDAYLTQLEQWYQECKTLADTAVDALKSYATDEQAREAARSYLGIKPNDDQTAPADRSVLDSVLLRYRQVQSHLNTKQEGIDKAWLFCGSEWLLPRQGTDEAYGIEGNPSSSEDDDGNPKPRKRIQDIAEYREKLDDGLLPFWSDDLSQYIFETPRGGNRYCDKRYHNWGGTQDTTRPKSVTICRRSFAEGGPDSLGSKTPVEGKPVMEYASKSITILHELFHLVLGTDKTPDEWSGLKDVLKIANQNAAGNYREATATFLPENLALFAHEYWLSQHAFPNDARWTFASSQAKPFQPEEGSAGPSDGGDPMEISPPPSVRRMRWVWRL